MSKDDKLSILLLSIPFISGIIILVIFGNLIYQDYQKTRDYKKVVGYYTRLGDSSLYKYIVNDIEYTVNLGFKVAIKPKEGSKKVIRYDENNPNRSVVVGFSGYTVFIIIGLMFVIIPGFVIKSYIFKYKNIPEDKLFRREKRKSLIVGIFLSGISYFMIAATLGEYNPLKLVGLMVESFSPLYIFIVILFIIGIFLIYKGIIGTKDDLNKSRGKLTRRVLKANEKVNEISSELVNKVEEVEATFPIKSDDISKIGLILRDLIAAGLFTIIMFKVRYYIILVIIFSIIILIYVIKVIKGVVNFKKK